MGEERADSATLTGTDAAAVTVGAVVIGEVTFT